MMFGRLAAVVGFALLAAMLDSGESGMASGPSDPVATARAHLATAGVQSARLDFEVVQVRDTQGGPVVTFTQTLDGVPIADHTIVVTLDHGGQRTLMSSGRLEIDHRAPRETKSIDSTGAEAIAANSVGSAGAVSTGEDVYVVVDGAPERAWRFVVSDPPLDQWLVTVSAVDGAVLETRSLVAADHPASEGRVFDPDPNDSSGGTVPPPVDCDSPANAATLDPQRITRTFQGISPAQGQLKGAYVDMTAPSFPGYKPTGQANEPTHVYNYACNDDLFEEANIYYHVDEMQRYIQSLGFTGGSALFASPIQANAHAAAGCNAFYYAIPPGIAFLDGLGTCGVPAAVDWGEDPGVIIHEYGHAIQDAGAAGVFFSTTEARAMAEGFADFFAAARFNDPCLFEWAVAIGAPGITCLRNIETGFYFGTGGISYHSIYPEGIALELHAGGVVWGAALWDIAQAFGGDQAARDKAVRLALQSHFSLTDSASFLDAATAIRTADATLYGGADDALLKSIFNARGICFPGDATPNIDPSIIDLSPPKGYDDVTLAAFPDAIGDACDGDDDNDGRPDIEETNGYGCGGFGATNPAIADTDGDMALDGPECDKGTNPNSSASEPSSATCGDTSDADGDKVLLFREVCYYSTNPALANTDGDTRNDGCEVYSVNGDLTVNVIDLQQVAAEQGLVTPPGTAVRNDFDVTKSGSIDVIDLQQIAAADAVCP